MGVHLSKFWGRLAEYPIQDKPVCFHLQKSFRSTGEHLPEENPEKTDAYDDLQAAFVAKLQQVQDKNWQQEKFPLWDQITLHCLQNVYLLLADEKTGLMDFEKFCCFLDSLQDVTSMDFRRRKFNYIDGNRDGFINLDEFLCLVYHYQSFDSLPKTCLETGAMIRKVMNMSLGEQLQSGLF